MSWDELWYKKSGDSFIEEDRIHTPYGWVSLTVAPDFLFVNQMCGDGRKLEKFCVLVAKKLGKKRIRWTTCATPIRGLENIRLR